MPLDKKIIIKIDDFSRKGKQNDIFTYLKGQLIAGECTAQQIYDYSNFYWKKKSGKTYVIQAETINKLGVVISGLKDPQQSKLSGMFFKISADRGNDWGCRNYAQLLLNGSKEKGIDKSLDDSLTYIEKAIKLTQANKGHDMHTHKLTYSKCLRELKRESEANTALMEYLDYLGSHKKPDETEIKSVCDYIKRSIIDFYANPSDEEKDSPSIEEVRLVLENIKPLLIRDIEGSGFELIQHEIYYMAGKMSEKVSDLPQAMLYYCKISIKGAPFYADAVAARARLLKETIDNQLATQAPAEVGEAKQDDLDFVDKKKLFLPSGVPLKTNFSKFWRKEANWFDSVDEKKLSNLYEKRIKLIEKLIDSARAEIILLEKIFQENADEPLGEIKNRLQENLVALRDLSSKINQLHKEHLAVYRSKYRRHMAERRFFDPNRSKKNKGIINLSSKIIDQRFRVDVKAPSAVNLDGISSRLFITAERSFQEAAIKLTGEDKPKLGIPVAREKSWSFGRGYSLRSGTNDYGPVEEYKVSDSSLESEHRANPKRQRLGDSYLPKHGTYDGDIYRFLLNISGAEQENEEKLAKLMIRYGNTHQSVVLKELKDIYGDAVAEDVDHFNRVCFLVLDKEQAQWHCSNDKDYHIGMAVAQARCLIMIEAGFLRFKETFKNTVLFGVYSHTGIVNNPEKVEKSCGYIDQLYMEFLKSGRRQDHAKFFKANIERDTTLKTVLAREQAHLDMKYVYGGESDTDDEGYDTDISIGSPR